MADPIVELKSGFIRGLVQKDEEGSDYYAFKGIPYAEPPVGKLRFKDPVAITKWTGVRDCCNYGPMCLQNDFYLHVDAYDEDCLHLNVFTHFIDKPNENAAVIVVIHGGAFCCSSSSDTFYGPEYLMRKNIVLVTINFRLGILGFLNLEDEIAPGNQGLKDQLMALQWVQNNIRNFGGDPRNVTVLGFSSGGVSAHILSLSPLSNGLYHKVISLGGSIFIHWYEIDNPKSKAIKLCSLLGKQLEDSKEIFDFLQSVEPKALQEAGESLKKLAGLLVFGPGVDTKSANPVIPVNLRSLRNQCINLPLLTGHNAQDGIFLLSGYRKEFFDMCEKDFGLLFKYHTENLLKEYNISANQIKRLYYKNEVVSEENMDIFVNVGSDIYFIEAMHKLAKVQADESSAPTYLYCYSYDAPESISKSMIDNTPKGASYFDELPTIFKMRYFKTLGINYPKKGTKTYKMMEHITEMWTNFAIYGNPTIEISDLTPVHWLPVNDGTVLRYLNLDEDITMQSTINLEKKLLSAKDIKV